MDTERMRRILAERGMRWEWYVNPYNSSEWWMLPDGTAMLASNWAPWESWPQCGRVIEAMRERGFPAFSARRCVDVGWYASFGKYFQPRNSDAMWRADGPEVYADTFTEASSLAAARALESEPADE